MRYFPATSATLPPRPGHPRRVYGSVSVRSDSGRPIPARRHSAAWDGMAFVLVVAGFTALVIGLAYSFSL